MMRVSWSLLAGSPQDVLTEALFCQRNGLDGVWWLDYQGPSDPEAAPNPELYVMMSMLASSTVGIFIGSMVTDVLKRHPMITAHAFATLSHIAPNRIILGLGAGGGTSHIPFGIPLDNLASKLEEGIEVIRALWRATPSSPAIFHGCHFQLNRAYLPILPMSKIPIYVAAYGPKMLKITAQKADGWIPESHTPQSYKKVLAKIENQRRSKARKEKVFEPCLAVIYYPFGPDEKTRLKLLKAARIQLAFYPDLLKTIDSDVPHPGLKGHQLAQKPDQWNKVASMIPDKIADSVLIYGTIDQCVERIWKLWESGCRHIIFEPYWIEQNKVKEAIEIAGKKIKPQLPK